ncbi:MAG: hypothetical protein OEV46_05235 [Betaproteobacteria bacterium]|jgi:hypothetical protein|nr:hypothetical protein [Betaproteobacteria bacterium]MDH5286022.1 hypothetical protein [Betaproteobacteria bacterium]
MELISNRTRVAAMALAAIVSAGLLHVLVAAMPPEAIGAPNEARNSRGVEPAGLASAPLRIEVIGSRSEETAAAPVPAARPGG